MSARPEHTAPYNRGNEERKALYPPRSSFTVSFGAAPVSPRAPDVPVYAFFIDPGAPPERALAGLVPDSHHDVGLLSL